MMKQILMIVPTKDRSQMVEEVLRYEMPYYRKYNMDVTPCSLLLEFGTDANTLEEAVYSAELVGEALARMLNKG
mgnify:CR=1 FL=1